MLWILLSQHSDNTVYEKRWGGVEGRKEGRRVTKRERGTEKRTGGEGKWKGNCIVRN